MPVLSGAVTFARFQVAARKPPADVKRWFSRALVGRAFTPLDPAAGDEDRSAGFVELEDHDATEFASGVLQGERALFAWRVDTVRVPAAEVRAEVDRWALAHEAEHGRAPGKRERAAKKSEIRHQLRGRATPATRVHDVSWNLGAGTLLVWAVSRKLVDEIAAAVEAAFGVELEPVTPRAAAIRGGVAEAAIAPTPELVGAQLSRAEVNRVEA